MLKIPWPYKNQPTNNDMWVHRVVFPFRNRGYFVELGAADGVRSSSCWLLERIGWRGICVEPSSVFFPALVRNRPKAICENVCVTGRTGLVSFVEDGYCSRVVRHKDTRRKLVQSVRLVDLLKRHKAPRVIDYLAVDCEGSDEEIVRDLPFGEYEVLALSMEAGSAQDILLANGYVKVQNPFNKECPWEMYYVKDRRAFNAESLLQEG